MTAIQDIKFALHDKFTSKDLGAASYFLGMKLCKKDTGILLNQRKYILDILHSFDVSNLPTSATRLPADLKIDPFLWSTSPRHICKQEINW